MSGHAALRMVVVAAVVSATLAGCSSGATPVTAPPTTSEGHLRSITVSGAYLPASGGGSMSGVYFTVDNHGAVPVKLVAAAVPGAHAQIESMSMSSTGTMLMRPLASITIPAGGTVKLDPNGLHVMLGKTGFVPGGSARVTLVFAPGGRLTFVVPIVASQYGVMHMGM